MSKNLWMHAVNHADSYMLSRLAFFPSFSILALAMLAPSGGCLVYVGNL